MTLFDVMRDDRRVVHHTRTVNDRALGQDNNVIDYEVEVSLCGQIAGYTWEDSDEMVTCVACFVEAGQLERETRNAKEWTCLATQS